MKAVMEQRGYWAMLEFLKRRQAEAPSDVLAGLLEELALVPGVGPSDAAVKEWNEAAKATFSYAEEPFTGLHLS